jgi:hypothetical protein
VKRTGLTSVTCEVQCLTDLTDHHHGLTGGALSAQVFGEKEFKLVVSPIHPPLGDIKVLSTLLFTHNRKLFCQAAQASLEGAWIHETKFSLTKISLFERLKFQAPLTRGAKTSLQT